MPGYSYPPAPQTGLGYRTTPSSLARDLISYWPLDEARGNRYDRLGTNHFFQDSTEVVTDEGKLGLAGKRTIYFPNNGSCALRAQPSPLLANSGNTGFTIAFWTRLSAAPQIMRFLMSGAVGAQNRPNFQVVYGWPYQYSWTISVYNTSDVMVSAWQYWCFANTWTFVVTWYDPRAGTVNVRLDGNPPWTYSLGGPMRFSTADQGVYMGHSWASQSYPLYGRFQDLAIWRRVLTTGEINAIWNGGKGAIWFEQTISPTWQQRFWAYPSVIEPVIPASPIGGSVGVRLMDAPLGAFTGMRLPESPLGGNVAPHLLGVLADPPYGAYAGSLPLPDAPLGGHAGPLEGLT